MPVDTTTLPSSVTGVSSGGAPLFSVWVPTAFGVAALAAIVLTALRLRHRHRARRAGTAAAGWWRRGASGAAVAGCVLLVVLTAAAAVNAYAGYLPTFGATGRFLTGRQDVAVGRADAGTRALTRDPAGAAAIAAGDTRWTSTTVHLSDPALRIHDRTVVVATPPGYRTTGRRYPVLYLFSGYPGRAADWFVSGHITETLDALAAAGRAPYAVLVAPDVNGGFFTDSETLDAVRGPQVETWVTRDVVGYVDARYRTVADRSGRVLAGMSSGGFAAINLALHHQDEFGQSLALEPYGDPGDVRQRLLGGSTALLRDNSPSSYLPTEPLHRLLPFFLDVPSGGDVAPVQALGAALQARREPVLLRVEKGQHHTWTEAAAGLPYALAEASRWLADPSALTASYPPDRFPVTGPDPFAGKISPDGEAALRHTLVCERTIQRAGDGPGVVPHDCLYAERGCPGEVLSKLAEPVTGTELTAACERYRPRPHATASPGASPGPAGGRG